VTLLVLLPDFGYHAAARQAALLAPTRRDVHVAALGPDGPLAAPLRAAGVPVHALGTERRFDPTLAWRLRRLVAELRPEVVHAWRLPALRAAGALRLLGRTRFRLVVSEPRRGGRWNAFDRWLLRRADAVSAGSPAEGDALRRLGLPADRVHALPPAVDPPSSGEPPPLGVELPPEAQLIVCVGALTPAHGFRDAIWALDILRYVAPDLHLAIIGDGPERGALGRFVRDVSRASDRVHFLGTRPDAAALLARADVVWVPSRSECGRQVALEAQAAGRPVVASALPGLAALVADGRTGLLTSPGDPPALARQTRRLLEDAELAARLGEAARQAAEAHAPARVAPAYEKLYRAS
jgi:glycosyltransferase involved in cell wall biosynthesis